MPSAGLGLLCREAASDLITDLIKVMTLGKVHPTLQGEREEDHLAGK